jgi:Tol biopolymer transport system component
MTRSLSWFPSLLGLVLLAIVVVSLPLILRNAPAPAQPAQVVSPPATPAETETPTPVAPTPEPTEDIATTTSEPVPTRLPTPVITPIPLAQPPIIPLPDGETQPYTLLFRQGATVQAIDHDGSNQRTLLDVQARTGLVVPQDIDHWGSPSPDGQRLALVLSDMANDENRQRGQIRRFSIYLFDRATDELRLLVDGSAEPVWSPDGAKIAYSWTGGLWVVNMENGETHQVYRLKQEADNFVTSVSWAPDSKNLVFSDVIFRQSVSMVALDIDNQDAARILDSPNDYWPSAPQWSPDGSKLLLVEWTKSLTLSDRGYYSLWTMNPDATEQVQLTYEMDVSNPTWSPDGSWIAFSAYSPYDTPEAYWDLWIVDPSSGELKRLTKNYERRVNVTSLKWAPDGSQIIYGLDRTEAWHIALATGEHSQLPITSTNFLILP